MIADGMVRRSAPVDADMAGAVLAIGHKRFPKALLDTIRRVAGVDHCMVFSFKDDSTTRCLLDIGNIAIGGDLGEAYSGHFHACDPNRETIFGHRAETAPILLPTFARRMYSDDYRKIFFEDADIVDKIATAIWLENVCFYVNFYKISAGGCFNRVESARLRRVAPAICAAVARHFERPAPAPQDSPEQSLRMLFETEATFDCLTGREREVCRRILLGYSSEAISAHLDISIHSTLTYRRRAYDKLGISSQNELFGIVLRLMTENAARA